MIELEELQTGMIFLVDKPLEWTSFQMVNKIRWTIKNRYKINKIKIGHAGTLDPKATGLLVICTGKKTKQIQRIQDQEKEYRGVIKLGASTPSFDRETEENKTCATEHITAELIEETGKQFLGTIMQKPPVYSAISKDGKRLYEYARRGEVVDIPAREVYIRSFEIDRIRLPFVHFRAVCNKGTYIRSLANDFGKRIGSCGYLWELTRTRIGTFSLEDSKSISDICKQF